VLCKKLHILEDEIARSIDVDYETKLQNLKAEIDSVNNNREAVLAGFERELSKHDVHPSVADSIKKAVPTANTARR
jgi:hypothetical protein